MCLGFPNGAIQSRVYAVAEEKKLFQCTDQALFGLAYVALQRVTPCRIRSTMRPKFVWHPTHGHNMFTTLIFELDGLGPSISGDDAAENVFLSSDTILLMEDRRA